MDKRKCICGCEMGLSHISFSGDGYPELWFWYCVGTDPQYTGGCGYWIPCDHHGNTGADHG
jgi:hypothetical protein